MIINNCSEEKQVYLKIKEINNHPLFSPGTEVNYHLYVYTVLVQTSDPQTSDATKVGQYKRRTYKRRTSTNIGLVQTLDWYKRRTSTNVGRVHL